jgi:hypothetical protein
LLASVGCFGEPTGCDLQDYYAILGLDPGASAKSIKGAYRRLARLHHPDVQASRSTESELASVAARMAQLNEAYAVLSHGKSRREYDERQRLESTLSSTKTTATATMDTQTVATQTKTTSNQAQRSRIRPRHDVDSTVVSQFSAHFRETFLSKGSAFSWKGAQFEGFDWGLEALSWSSHYCIALRGFTTIDSAAAKKFINYSEMVVASHRRIIRSSYFLFLLPFRQVSEWESVSSQCQPFVAGKNHAGLSIPPTGMVLFDIDHGRTLRFGSPFRDKRFEQLIQSLKTSS